MKIALGTQTWGAETSYADARRIFEIAWEGGVRIFDTAPTYNDGEAERILGDCLRTVPVDQCRVMTKCAYDGVFDQDEPARSLERLGIEWVDALFLHRAWMMTPAAMMKARDAILWRQRAKRVGLSNVAAWQAASTNIDGPLQVLYNLLKRQAEAELLPFAKATGREVFCYSPLAGGLLTGGGLRMTKNPRYARRYAAVCRILQAAPDALAWVTQNAAVTAAIVGPRNPVQMSGLLFPSTMPHINIALPPIVATDRTEEACTTES